MRITEREPIEWLNNLIETMKSETSGNYPDPEYKDEVYEALDMAIEALEQQKEGHWIPMGIVDGNGNRNYECSECHHSDVQAESMTVPYCWFCGAHMKCGD